MTIEELKNKEYSDPGRNKKIALWLQSFAERSICPKTEIRSSVIIKFSPPKDDKTDIIEYMNEKLYILRKQWKSKSSAKLSYKYPKSLSKIISQLEIAMNLVDDAVYHREFNFEFENKLKELAYTLKCETMSLRLKYQHNKGTNE